MESITEIKQQVLVWIDISLSDLRSSKILYTSGKHRTSYFLFQQAVEKANKAYALFIGKTEKDLKDYSHDQMKIYREPIAEQKIKVQNIVNAFSLFPRVRDHEFIQTINFPAHIKAAQEALAMFDGLRFMDLVNIPLGDIRYLLDEIYAFEAEKMVLPKEPNIAFIDSLRKSIAWISEIEMPGAIALKKECEEYFSSKENADILLKVTKEMLRLLNALSTILSTFVICAYFTIQHSSLTRYPINGKNPLKIYNKKLPLVRDQEEIMAVFESALKKFKRIVNAKPFTM